MQKIDKEEYFNAVAFEKDKEEYEKDPLNYLSVVTLDTDEHGEVFFPSVSNAEILEGKYWLDKAKTRHRVDGFWGDGENRRHMKLLMNPDEMLSEVIKMLPCGLIDKKITGIGATYLELHCDRNSIIVTPTRALALNKLETDFLYVGSKEGNQRATSKAEIKTYLNNTKFQYKKILVVADSIDKVIEAVKENNEDVYSNYFLLVDEIDTLQSDNHFRPVLSRVIDHYFNFKSQRKALLSATVREFSHPKLQKEPLISIESDIPLKRNINLFHTNNINSLLAKKIAEISNVHTSDKILIAYNSVLNILQTIKLLPVELQNHEICSILCSEASRDEAGNYLNTLVEKTNKLPCMINFMTCSYFTGLDIEDRYHLITVSNSKKVYSALPVNKIIQIYGRCRIPDGILSDTILYNYTKKPLRNLTSYRDNLSKKATKVIDLLEAANTMKEGDRDLEDLFSRIDKVIIEKATERLFEQQSFELTRKTVDNELEISHFNIDALYEKMEAYSKLYSSKEGLYNHLKELYPTTNFYDVPDSEEDDIKEAGGYIKEESNQRLLNRLLNNIGELISLSQTNCLNDCYLDRKINSSKRREKAFYERIKAHYNFYDIVFLAKVLFGIALKNKKSYRNLNNTLSFRVLEDTHPFKLQIFQAFRKKKKYTSEEIADILKTIVKDQFFKTLPMKTSSQSRLMNLFKSCVDYTYTGGKYLVKGYKPKFNNVEIPEPVKKISKETPAINYFEINTQSKDSTNTFFIL